MINQNLNSLVEEIESQRKALQHELYLKEKNYFKLINDLSLYLISSINIEEENLFSRFIRYLSRNNFWENGLKEYKERIFSDIATYNKSNIKPYSNFYWQIKKELKKIDEQEKITPELENAFYLYKVSLSEYAEKNDFTEEFIKPLINFFLEPPFRGYKNKTKEGLSDLINIRLVFFDYLKKSVPCRKEFSLEEKIIFNPEEFSKPQLEEKLRRINSSFYFYHNLSFGKLLLLINKGEEENLFISANKLAYA